MLNLDAITNERKQAVYCRTLEEARELYNAVKEQRPNISLKGWGGAPNDPTKHAGKAYMLSFLGCNSFKYGSPDFLRSEGIEILAFNSLRLQDLPEFEKSDFGMEYLLSL